VKVALLQETVQCCNHSKILDQELIMYP